MRDQRAGWYDTAQICLNGHVITQVSQSAPEFRQEFCERCGEPTITVCRKCNTAIRGLHHAGAGRPTVGGPYSPPGFCHDCGEPYPWTATALQAAQELADELDDLTDEERETLKNSLDDLVRDTPRTAVAATRFKKLVARAGPAVADALKEILVDVVSESAKKLIWP